ncbi:hypothetical protein FRE64_06865 [Euhalothece natronophila Z-M001]|uniref:Uncharacterized protein n=1 Tax=Euhalothece natronophila Z-M001 TaxID=522448 RepID=A0A5B8NL86_9CHRO|nr:hypothetical protein [Euhalothece natronophila]QDZ39677.1 hypothetical protein FRE64_06865 [Euhalothece natronophila Z-M001]
MRKTFLIGLGGVMLMLFPQSAIELRSAPEAIAASSCPQNFESLSEKLLDDLPSYANRVIQRSKSPSRTQSDSTYFIVAGKPDLNPLKTDRKGDYTPAFPNAESDDVKQIFFTTLERKYQKTEVHSVQNYHWLFLTESEQGWYLVSLYSRFGLVDEEHPPTPPKETHDGIVGQAIQLWLRDCRSSR